MMKKQIPFLLAAALLFGTTAGAAIRNEWNFQQDAAGTLLAGSVNSGTDGDTFASGGTGVLEADGLGSLLSTPSGAALWDDGATLDATLSTSTNVLYLRYDLNYDLPSEGNTNGATIGIQFVDSTGTNVAGLAMAYDPTGALPSPAGKTLTQVGGNLDFSGTLSAIAKIDLSGSPTITVWYDTTGANSFTEGSPAATNAISLSSISDLRIQATGTTTGETNNFISVENIRVADSWADISGDVQLSVDSKYLNEWLFDRDIAGRTLSEAVNSGSDQAVFSTDTTPVTQTDGRRSLICSNEITGVGDLWNDGAVLRADVTNQSSGVRFLRYDLRYDMTATNINDSGTLIGLAFADTTSTNLAGVGLLYDSINGATPPPAGIQETVLEADLALTGNLAVIAKVDLDAKTMDVWYDLSGNNTFSASGSPNATVTNLHLTTIEELEFRATGDFITTSSNQCVVIDNIRTSATWTEITNAPANLLAPPNLNVTITDSLGGGMAAGQTNQITVTIKNTGGPALNVFSTLSHDGGAGLSIISSNNTPAPMAANGSLVQTYTVLANADGSYVLTAQATSDETNSVPATFDLLVGRRISYQSYAITNESGGIITGDAEPGETFDLIITSVNDGGATVTGITNSLSANSSFFTSIVALDSTTYALLNKDDTASTTYRVTCSPATPGGLQPFTVINSSSDGVWTNQFNLNVRREAIPQVSTNALTITVAPGERASASLILTNIGNASGSYTLNDVGNWGGYYYTVSTQTASKVTFYPNFDEIDSSTTFTNWGSDSTATMPIGFSFPLMGSSYANFFVSKYGAVSFSAAVAANTTATLPSGTAALAAPFWGSTAIDTNTIRYSKTKVPNALVVAWGNQTGAEFQTWLYSDGRIRYLYDQGSWSGGAIGTQQSATLYQSVAYQPGSSGESILLTPAKWVTHTPSSGSLSAGGSQVITYTADATGRSTGTTVLTNTVSMGGSTETVIVTVVVQAATKTLTVTPSTVTFSGRAGTLASTSMIVSNSGNTTLNYRITDTNAQGTAYAWTNTTFSWDETHWDANSFDAVPLLNNEDDKTDWIPFGFDFSFYGAVYTQFKIDANGGIVLNSPSAVTGGYDRVISVYGPVTSLDGNSSLRYSGDGNKMVVTWENMYQDADGQDQTFQLITYKNGTIRCQYRSVEGSDLWPVAGIYVDDNISAAGRETTATLESSGTDGSTVTYTTNYVVTTNGYVYDTPVVSTNTSVTTNYAAAVREKAILFYPSQRLVISFSPATGTLAPKTSASVTIYGDARSLPVGGSDYSVTNRATLAVASEAPTVNASVTFTATNSAASSYTALAADAAVRTSLWGTDDPFVSSVLNSDGSRTLSWPVAEDPLSRRYTIWYTTNLASGWAFLDAVDNLTVYTDRQNNTEPVIFYKVTVE